MQSDSTDGAYEATSSVLKLPSLTRQTTYGLTGALAGICTVPIDVLWERASSGKPQRLLPFLRDHAPAPIYRAAVRFWAFDVAKSQLQAFPIPTAIKGGLSGAAGGFAEICAQSLMHRSIPTVVGLATQSSKLFFCFGTYTHLSTTLSPEQLPPKPFWYCWIMGSTAGAIGSGIIARVEGVKGKMLWRNAVPKGALTIGTVIAVQVTSCARML